MDFKSPQLSSSPPTVMVVSDGTGQTAEQLVQAALVQFEPAGVTVLRRHDIRTPDDVHRVVREAAPQRAIILHTFAADDLRRLVLSESRLLNVDSLDMLGPVLERLAAHLHLRPQEKPGLFRQRAEAHTRQIEAVAFAFAHDDGQRAHELHRAEVVLVGVSRSMKTPTMLYLAYRGWFAANVPLVPDVPLPPSLFSLPPEKVFCLVVSPARLRTLRRSRARQEGIPIEPYTSMPQIKRELDYADRLCRQHEWQRVSVRGKSVEEVCREIIALLPDGRSRQV